MAGRAPLTWLVPLLLLLLGCRGDGTASAGEMEIRVQVAPTPPVVGPARIVVTLRDRAGTPVEGAEVWIEGLMAHPGMIPTHVEAESAGGGMYAVPDFDFSMAGDWVLITRVWLADETERSARHEVRVVSGSPAGGS